jgi:hypothetical protein
MEIGKKYSCSSFTWLLLPEKEMLPKNTFSTPTTLSSCEVNPEKVSTLTRDYWSNEFKCNIEFLETNTVATILDKEGTCYKVQSSDGFVGWLRTGRRNFFEEIVE